MVLKQELRMSQIFEGSYDGSVKSTINSFCSEESPRKLSINVLEDGERFWTKLRGIDTCEVCFEPPSAYMTPLRMFITARYFRPTNRSHLTAGTRETILNDCHVLWQSNVGMAPLIWFKTSNSLDTKMVFFSVLVTNIIVCFDTKIFDILREQ